MRRRLEVRERNGALVSLLGLVALAVSLAGGSGAGGEGSSGEILLWLAATAAAAFVVAGAGRRIVGVGVANGIAGGLFFSIGDISTKVATQGEGPRLLFVIPLILGYTLGTWLLQVGYQRSAALTVAGVATRTKARRESPTSRACPAPRSAWSSSSYRPAAVHAPISTAASRAPAM